VAGVALLEAMLSVSLVGIGMLVSLRAIGSGASLQSRVERRAVVRRLAEQQMAVLAAGGAQSLQVEGGGRFEGPFAEYAWSSESAPPTEQSPFTLVELTVWRGTDAGGRKDAYSMQTLVRCQ